MKKVLYTLIFFISLVSCSSINNNSRTLSAYLKDNKISYIMGENAFLNKNGDIIDKNKKVVNGKVLKSEKSGLIIIANVKDGRYVNMMQEYVLNDKINEYLLLKNVSYTLNKDAFVNKNNSLVVNINGENITGNIYLKSDNNVNLDYIFTGDVVNGKYEGIVEEFIGENLVSELFYVKGKKNGISKYYFPNGFIKAKMNYKDDILNGITEEYFGEGGYGKISRKINYKNGVPDGEEINYNSSGKSSVRYYKDGVLNGKYIGYFNNGKAVTFYNYIDGKIEGEKTVMYPFADAVLMKTNYINNMQDGEEIYYYDNGKVAVESAFQRGKRVTPIIGYRKDGSKKFIIYNLEKHDGYCYGKDGKKSRDFNSEEKTYSITGLMFDNVCE